jgi:hypothetical protein
MPIEEKLGAMDLTLPAPLVPPGTFELVKVHGGLAYIAGHGPFDGTTRSYRASWDATSLSTRPTMPPGSRRYVGALGSLALGSVSIVWWDFTNPAGSR